MSLFSKIKDSPVFKSVGIYSLSGFLAKGVSFLLIPVFTNLAYMSPEDNGILNIFSQTLLFLSPFISLGVLQSLSTDFFKLEKKEFSNLLVSGILLSSFVTLISIGVFWLFKDTLLHKYKFPLSFFWLIPLISYLTFFYELTLGMFRSTNKPWSFFGINIAKIITELGLAILLITIYHQGWKGRVSGILVGCICIALYAGYYFYKNGYLNGRIQKKYLKQELIYALPIIFMQFSVFCMNSSDRFFLLDKNNGNAGVVGIYGIACTFASIIMVFAMAFLLYAMPKIYQLLSEPQINLRLIKKQFVVYFGVVLGGLSLMYLFTPLFYALFIPKIYHTALPYFYFIAGGYAMWCITYLFYSFLLYYKLKRKITILSIFNIIISLTLYYFFINKWNQWGAAIATFVSYFIILIITLLFCKPYIKQLLSKQQNERINL